MMDRPEVRISRRALSRLAIFVGIPLLIAGVYWIGCRVTPYTGGEPVLLSPQVRATVLYRDRAMAWTARLQALDAGLVGVQTGSQDVYEQMRQVDAALDSAARLAQEIEVASAPSALAGLRALLLDSSQRYYAAAQSAAQWVGAPSPENAQALDDALVDARAAWGLLSASRWLTGPSQPESALTPAAPVNDVEELPRP